MRLISIIEIFKLFISTPEQRSGNVGFGIIDHPSTVSSSNIISLFPMKSRSRMKYIKSRPGGTIRMEYFELMKGFLFSPEETFRTVKDTDSGDTLIYFMVLVLISAVLSVPIIMLVSHPSIWTMSGVFFQARFRDADGIRDRYYGCHADHRCPGLPVHWCSLVNLRVYPAGGRNGRRETLKALAFGQTPAPPAGVDTSAWDP